MQTNQISSKEKKQFQRFANDSDHKINQGKNESKKANKNDAKSKERRYWEPLIPRSDRKDRLEIW